MKKLFLCLFFVSGQALAAPTMTLSTQTPKIGEQMQIIFEDTQPIGQVPDLSTLQEHFVVRGQQSAFNSSIINGVQSQSHRLILSVFPKEVGTFSIGPFEMNQTQLPAQTVTVSEQAALPVASSNASDTSQSNVSDATQSMPADSLFQVEAQIEPKEIYIGETALYSVRFTENIGLTQAQVEMSPDENFTFTQLGNDKMGRTLIQNQPARFFERNFLLTPKQSGDFTVPPAGVIGYLPDKNFKSSRFGFPDLFGQDPFFDAAFGLPQKEVYRQSQPIQLTVLPKPDDWKGWWLPSRKVTLSETYQFPQTLKVGQPIERRVRLQASGVEGHQLPLLVQPAGQGVKVYANPDQRGQMTTAEGLTGYEEMTFVLVPTESGKMIIPEIKVSWFNTKDKKGETALLPAKEITVEADSAAGVMQVQQPTPPSKSEPEILKANEVVQKPIPPLKAAEKTVSQSTRDYFLIGGFGFLFLLLCLGGCMYFMRVRRVKTLVSELKKNEKAADSHKKPLPDLYPF